MLKFGTPWQMLVLLVAMDEIDEVDKCTVFLIYGKLANYQLIWP